MIEKLLQRLPIFKGKQRLARVLLRNKMASGLDLQLTGKYGCAYKIPNIKENVGFELFINGVYEEEIINLIIERLPVNGVMLDIGANIGAIAIPVCKRRADINAIAIEASPRVYNYLQHNKELNHLQNCILINNAVTDMDNETVNFFSPEEKFGKGSLSSVFTKQSETVETISLDSICKQNNYEEVDVIKIDIEGHEYGAFKGGSELLSKPNAPDILFEFVDWAEDLAKDYKPGDAQQLLLDYGYKLFNLNSRGVLAQIFTPFTKGAAMIMATKKTA